MNIAFVWFWDRASSIIPFWHDGLSAAIDLISKEHKVDWYLDKQMPKGDYDFTLMWDDSNSEFFKHIDSMKGRKGICLTTDPQNFDNLRKLDVVFCESEPIYQAVRQQGIRAIKAFGTDTDFFIPNDNVDKDIPMFYPATFSPWKRQSEIAHWGEKLTCVGTVQPDGKDEYQMCIDKGVNVEVGYFPAEKIRSYYQRAIMVPIPAIHGSERTVLEAMSSNIVPDVNPDNERASSYVKEYNDSEFTTPREFVVANYSHKTYRDALLKGICS